MSTELTLTAIDAAAVIGLTMFALGLLLATAELVLLAFPRLERFLTRTVLGLDPDRDKPAAVEIHIHVVDDEPDPARFVDLAGLHLGDEFAWTPAPPREEVAP